MIIPNSTECRMQVKLGLSDITQYSKVVGETQDLIDSGEKGITKILKMLNFHVDPSENGLHIISPDGKFFGLCDRVIIESDLIDPLCDIIRFRITVK